MSYPVIAPQNLRHLVFDLGGVLIQLNPQRLRSVLSAEAMDSWKQWMLTDPIAVRFESGHCSVETFIRAAAQHIGCDDQTGLRVAFSEWVQGPHPSAGSILSAVRPPVQVHCLSNTNALHWARLQPRIEPWFQHCFLSHQLKMAKPDVAIYLHVAEVLGAAPEEILFVDDNPLNVRGAIAAGWQARHVRHFQDTVALLSAAGLLQSSGLSQLDEGLIHHEHEGT